MSRLIFGAGLILSAIILIIVVVGNWNTEGSIPDEVSAGYALWQSYGCESCHTLFGQGGNYGPDLTRIYNIRGENYIREFMINPSAYHPDQRWMPRFTITQDQISDLVALLGWTANDAVFAKNWPPNTIRVAGSGSLTGSSEQPQIVVDSNDPLVTRGSVIYSQLCSSCHSIEANVVIVGPSFRGLADRARVRFPDMAPQDYIRISILTPSAYVVEGFQDVMQRNLGEVLSSEDIEAVIAFIMSLSDNQGVGDE